MTFTDTIKKYRTTGRGRVFVAAIAIIAAIGGAAAAHAFGDASRGLNERRGRRGAESIRTIQQALGHGSPWLDLLKIRENQRAQLLEIVDRHEPALTELESKRSRLTEQFASTFTANGVNPLDVEQFRAEIRGLSEQAVDESLAVANEAAQILTPEQRARLVSRWLAH